MRIKHEGSTAAWIMGTLMGPSVQGHGLLQPQVLWLYQGIFFKSLVAGSQVSLAGLFYVTLPVQALR